VTADLSAIDFSKAGTYEVILTAADGQTKTVKLTILSLPDIKATDKTMYVGDRLTKEDILNWATFINPEGMPVGFEVVGNAIPISATDQLTTSGTYTIKYYIQGKSRSVENILAEKEITLTVKEKEHPSVDPGKPKKSISKGNLTSKKKSLPNTGEQNTNTLYSIGILLLIMVLGGYTRMKYWKKK
ncbi:LPXTG cell wall anchor domain-containing protein, partial [Enterococcus sp. 7D2_DIV0200]